MNHRTPPAWSVLLALTSALPFLLAFDYGAPILIRGEADIFELEYAGEIDEEQRDMLLQLLADPLELNTATWDELQMLPDVTAELATALVEGRALDPLLKPTDLREYVDARTWFQCRPFVTVGPRQDKPWRVRGHVALRALDQVGDDRVPVVYLKGRVKVSDWLDTGVLLAEQEDLYGVEYSDTTILVAGRRPRVTLERIHALVKRPRWSLVAGHYQAGFGQGLTFDVTDRTRPHGFYSDLQLYEDYENHDSFSVSKRLLGVAGRKLVYLPSGQQLDFTAFGSVNPHDLYYTAFEPHDYRETGTEEVAYPTFPHVYREELIGLNATFRWASRSHVGVTAWGGRAVERFDIEFTDIPIPNRPFFGAVGLNAAFQYSLSDFFAEVAVTDSGGVGTRVEWLYSPGLSEISTAFRYYGSGFDNPHSRGRSQPDEYAREEEEDGLIPGGKRDRDEVGPQLQAVVYPTRWLRLRAKGDLWHRPSLDVTHLHVEGRADVDPLPWLGFDLLAGVRDKDVTERGREYTYTGGDADEEKGERISLGAGVRLVPLESLVIQSFVKDSYEDDSGYEDAYLHTVYTWTKVMWDVTSWLELTFRFKVHNEDLADPDSGDHYVDLYGQLGVRPPGRVLLQVRYHVRRDVGDAEADLETIHKLKACAEVRF